MPLLNLLLDDVFYGSADGKWLYPLINGNVDWPINLGLMLAALAGALVALTWRHAEQAPVLVVVVWLGFGSWAQSQMRELAPFPDTDVVGSKYDCFCKESKSYQPGRFLREFHTIAPDLHFHVRANMAGKVLFYHLIRVVSDKSPTLVWLVFGASNLGAVLAYAIVWELFRDRRAALAALVLYLFLPSKLFFFPLLNSVTPVFILFLLWLQVRYLAKPHAGWLAAMGVALYALVLFEPLPLVTGLVFLALIGRAWALGAIARKHVLSVLVLVPVAFFVVDLLVWWGFGYEIMSAFRFALHDAQEFNKQQNRPYGLWVVFNLVETLSNTGLLASGLALGLFAAGAVRLVRAFRSVGWAGVRVIACEPGVCLSFSTLATLLVVDALGVNRGETVRLWIFLGVFLVLPVSGLCGRRPAVLAVLVLGAIMQACIGLQSRGFVLPG
ncbi:MAG TPA: hypothetical protein VGE74_06495 [Gemmata sp.]